MSARDSVLLSTKLNRPPVTNDWVDRPRLIEQLNRSLQHGMLTLVCASAGFGKTSLVSSWIESLSASERPPTPSAWLSLDEYDSDLMGFLRYFVAAIRAVFPESCTDTLALLRTPIPTAQAPLVTALANDLEQLPSRVLLVLDDYHTICGEAVHDLLSELMRHWPQHLHLVLISRSSPPLPLANLRAKRQLGEIRTRDLRFTPDETANFLGNALAEPLSESAMAFLDQRLEGWIAGLHLVTLSLRAGASVGNELEVLSGAPVDIADYLVDEVLSTQTPAIQKFLLTTSILDRFCTALCERMLSGAADNGDQLFDARASIQFLESHNVFVIPLDNERRWYRYHHLFQEFLQRRLLAEISSVQVTELHHRAATWFAEQGLIDEALRHALAINDLDLAAQLMVAGLCDVLNREDRLTLERWLRLLPDEFVQRQPWLLMIKAVVLSLSWQLAASWRVLGQIEALLGAGDEHVPRSDDPHVLAELRGMIASLRGQEAYIQGHVDRAIAYCEESLELMPNRWNYVRGIAMMYWGLGMQATARGDIAQRVLMDEYAGLDQKADSYALRLLFAACFNSIEAGDLEQARWMAETKLAHSVSSQLLLAAGFAHYFLGVVHYYWNDLDASSQHFEKLVDRRFSYHTQAVRNGMIGLARIHLARADISAARLVTELLSQFDLDRLGQDGDDTRSLAAQLAYFQGDSEAAYRWADSYAAPAQGRSLLWLQDPHLAKARILLARGRGADVQSALDILDVLHEFAQNTFNVRVQIEVLALRAMALQMQAKAADAIAAMQRSLELARPGGIIRVFIDLGPDMREMLFRLAEQGFADEFIRRILAGFPDSQALIASDDAGSRSRAVNAGLIEPLTERELDVLALLRERQSNKEIAQALVLSPATVKRYTVNIYQKLGVSKRWDAVVKAEALGILPPR